MTWLKMDDGFDEHFKVAGLTDAAFRLHVSAMCYAKRNLTDGAISWPIVKRIGAAYKESAELVDAGLWEPVTSVTDMSQREGSSQRVTAWLIHDWEEMQRTRDQVEEDRAKAAARQQKSRKRRKQAEDVTPASQPGHSPVTPQELEVEVDSNKTLLCNEVAHVSKGAGDTGNGAIPVIDDLRPVVYAVLFPAFWKAYPNKKGKTRAQGLWSRLSEPNRRKAIDRLPQYVASVDAEYLQHGDTYLSKKTWNDFDAADVVKPLSDMSEAEKQAYSAVGVANVVAHAEREAEEFDEVDETDVLVALLSAFWGMAEETQKRAAVGESVRTLRALEAERVSAL